MPKNEPKQGEKNNNTQIKRDGGAGYRSRYLSHAKRALYHLSYAPWSVRRRYFASIQVNVIDNWPNKEVSTTIAVNVRGVPALHNNN